MKILVYGLSGSGKTTFSKNLKNANNKLDHYEADIVREAFNDWSFDKTARERQAERLLALCNLSNLQNKIGIADFICPYDQYRNDYNFDFEITNFNYDRIIKKIINEF